MVRTEVTRKHVIETYVAPARLRGEKTLMIRVGSVLKELGWTNRTPSVFSTLSSQTFQREAGLELIGKRGGPASGGPSTTVQFLYRVLDSPYTTARGGPATPDGGGIMDLYGIGADAYKQLGGGKEYLEREREELRFPAEGYPRSGRQA
jgi:hypothetical protein